ncbi:type I restriction endonuclease [Paenibacillus sp. TRM 82003]|nr:type I restriction endonuclease [Paenibacillus sp. TRM 82003]
MTTTNTREEGFEAAIETHLIEHGGYENGSPAKFNRELALFPETVFRFWKQTQPAKWQRLESYHGADVENKVIQRLVRELNQRGTLDVLRHGITDYGVKLQLAYFAPASGLNPEAVELYQQNILEVTRQVRYSLRDTGNELDMVLSINGLPIATVELKNQLTHQTVKHAIKQYRETRDPRDPLLQFKTRALVHFAVDPDEVYMTTKLNGDKTFFLPFNKGDGNGAGNPPNPRGYKTSYLWEEVWSKDSWMDILARFLHLEEKDGKESIIFPRYHQLVLVRKLEQHAKTHGPGQNYLAQHSAGSGKSNSIAWTAHRLSGLHDANDEPVFDSTIVITDRKVLDKQLQDTIYQFEHKQGVVQKIDDDSTQLAQALNSGTRIIISTLQKFRYILDKVEDMPGKRFAVIIDEAHSSQTGESAGALRDVLSVRGLDEAAQHQERLEEAEDDTEEEIIRQLLRRGRKTNVSFFAFTATPKAKTLEMFGQINPDTGKPEPFHLYSMRQAIEEGFIHDVLKHYMTYSMYYNLAKKISEDPLLDKKKAARAIARFVSLHPHSLAQKTEVMIEHFRLVTRHKMGGKAKAMVVTSSRLHAVRYKLEFDRYIQEKGYTDLKTLVAFSGTVKDDDVGEEYTEPGINGFGERELPEQFASDEYQVLIVADKYQTGFDQPLLHTMYVDKKLSGIKAVQTLSRLNRTAAGKVDTFVLDFVNKAEDIQASFQPFFEQTTIENVTDPNILYDLKSKLDGSQVYWDSEVDGFAKVYFSPHQTSNSQGLLNRFLDPAVDRYKAKPEDEQDDFKNSLTTLVRVYSFISQIVPFQDPGLHKLFVYGQYLARKLPRTQGGGSISLDDDVDLQYYRLEKTSDGSISLIIGEESPLQGVTHAGTARHGNPVEAPLSQIIHLLNERFGTEFTEADQLFFDQLAEEMVEDEELSEQARNNTMDNFKFAFDEKFIGKLIDRMELNQEIFARIMDDERFQGEVKSYLLKSVYERIKKLG